MSNPDPSDAQARLARALDHHEHGRLREAEADYLEVVAAGYRADEISLLLAGLAEEDGRPEVALSRWETILRKSPDNPSACAALGRLHLILGQPEAAVAAYRTAASRAPDDPDTVSGLGVALADAGHPDEALSVLLDAARRWPDIPVIQHRMRQVATTVVPSWHIPMMNDTPRNAAFERAIRAAIAAHGPSATVLDIGAGSGLLSLLAARSGAASVVACEMVPAVAEIARQIVERNGYADRVRVVPRKSTEIAVGDGLDGPADVLVSEILSNTILTEGVLPTFEDALHRLMKPSASIIPRAVTAVGCLVGGPALERLAFVGSVSGFDLSPFGVLAAPRLPVNGQSPPWTRLSADCDLVTVDLTEKFHAPQLTRVPLRVSADGVAAGILQWMRIQLDETTAFSNPPDSATTGGWQQVFHTFPKPIRVVAGQILEIAAGHDRTALILSPA